jgi:hypothetical protein
MKTKKADQDTTKGAMQTVANRWNKNHIDLTGLHLTTPL